MPSFKFHQFAPDGDEEISDWLAQLDSAMHVAAVPEADRVQYLIATIGPEGYKALKDLAFPETPDSVPMATVKRLLTRHYEPRRVLIAERAKFHTRTQRADESCSSFYLALKKLASTCEFAQVRDPLSENIRDRFVAGLKSDSLRERLCEATLNLTATYEKALNLEATKASSWSEPQNINMLKSVIVRVPNAATARGASHGQSNSQPYRGKRGGKRQFAQRQPGPQPSQADTSTEAGCAGCGGSHARRMCPYKNTICNGCGNKGHLKRCCRITAARQAMEVKHTSAETVSETQDVLDIDTPDEATGFLDISHTKEEQPPKDDRYLQTLIVEGIPLVFEIDTGSAVTVIPMSVYSEHFSHLPVRPLPAAYRGYGGNQIPMLGLIIVQVSCPVQAQPTVGRLNRLRLPLAICTRPGAQPLLGRPWLRQLPLVIDTASAVNSLYQAAPPQADLMKVIQDLFPSLFLLDGSAIIGFEADMHLKEGTIPVKRPAYSCPLALKTAVEQELDNMVADNALVPVLSSPWATPIVILRRPENKVRLCGNYKVTVNPALEMDHYPLPNMEEMLTTISGKYFFVLDLHKAYLQMLIGTQSKGILTWNTHKGLFEVLRLPYGVASAPAIFQNFIETVLKGLSNVKVLLDDVIGFAETRQECYDLMLQVLLRFCSVNVKIRLEKCQLILNKVKYLGNTVSYLGVSPLITKVQDVHAAPPPPDLDRLRSFLGLINWHARFIPKLAEVAHPLIALTRQNTVWNWSEECRQSFEQIKRMITADAVLVPYSLHYPLRVTCDASPYGLAAALSHIINNEERVIAYASHTLTQAERNYAQIMREAAAIIFAVKRFYRYLIGREFELVTDNRALVSILGSKKGLSQTAIGRLQRWALMLGGFQYKIVHRPGTEIPHVDGLSRLPAPSTGEVDQEINHISWSEMPVDSKQVAEQTASDKALQTVSTYVQQGWPIHVHPLLLPFWQKRHELSIESSCLFWGQRLVIPESLKGWVLRTLHESHPGITKMKGLARSHVWWPGLDADLEAIVRECLSCQRMRPAQQPGPAQSWPLAVRPWERIHVDHASFMVHTLLIIIDAFSRWPIVKVVPSTDATSNIAVMRSLFAAYGLPETVCSDNGPPFFSAAFREFLESTGTRYLNAPPYNPKSNGLVEELVKTTNLALAKVVPVPRSGAYVQAAIDSFLLSYRTTPHSRTGVTPASLFLGRELRTRLSVMRPMPSHDDTPCAVVGREYKPGDAVLVRKNKQWEPAVVTSKNGNVTYVVNMNGTSQYCHRDIMKPCPEVLRPPVTGEGTARRGRKPVLPTRPIVASTVLPPVPDHRRELHVSPGPSNLPQSPAVSPVVNTPRQSSRPRQAPQRLEYHHLGSPQ